MLAHLIAIGAFGDGGTVIVPPVPGDLMATADRIVTIAEIQSITPVGSGIPLGAPKWVQPFDPADHVPFAFNFAALLGTNDTITGVDAISVSATGAALGVTIDSTSGHLPTFTNDGHYVQFWPLVDQTFWESLSFDASGVLIVIKTRVLTAAGYRYERSGVLQVRQQ